MHLPPPRQSGDASLNEANTQNRIAPDSGNANPGGRFAGKVVLITGATSGIGEATAKAFAHEGAKVFFCGRRENLGAGVERAIREHGGDATYRRADVRDPKQVEDFVRAGVKKYGRLTSRLTTRAPSRRRNPSPITRSTTGTT